MNTIRPHFPTPQLVSEYISRFGQDERYGIADIVLERAFGLYPYNTNLEDVLTKVVLLNSLYNTIIYAVIDMARHIQSLEIDGELALGSPEVIDRIAKLTVRGTTIRHYAFATKYCSWHSPNQYPIFDNLVERLLWQYQCHYNFYNFKRPDLHQYSRFREIFISFQLYFGLQQCTFKDIDKFLWFYAKELYIKDKV
jgi:hypothetical protein